ncbi:MAG: alpha/beta hydrolase fold domain-containing protein [Terracidiphilus sp.]
MALADEEMLALLAPEYRAYIERLRAKGWPPLDRHTVPEARARMREMQNGSLPPGAVATERHTVDGFSVLILRPVHAEGILPAVVYYHGGGWVLGDFDTHARMAGEIAVQSRAAVVFVEYARAPESRFPLPLEQCYRALKWTASQGRSIGLDGARLAVAGDSAGGTLAAGVAMLAARRGGPEIRLQALLYPVADCTFATASYRDFETGLNLDLPAMRWFWDHYLPDAEMRAQPLASPLRATPDELRNLPPALVITAECDVLRDEGEAFARKLAQAGVPVIAVRFAGTLHAFMMIDELAHDVQAASAMALLASELRQAFAGAVAR